MQIKTEYFKNRNNSKGGKIEINLLMNHAIYTLSQL